MPAPRRPAPPTRRAPAPPPPRPAARPPEPQRRSPAPAPAREQGRPTAPARRAPASHPAPRPAPPRRAPAAPQARPAAKRPQARPAGTQRRGTPAAKAKTAAHRTPAHSGARRPVAVPSRAAAGGGGGGDVSLGRFEATAYGPPWGGIQGGGTTATGINLHTHPQQYIIAVDPSVIRLHTRVHVIPNPFGDNSIVFRAEDTGGAIKGHRIDIYDWRGRSHQLGWGRRNVTVTTAVDRGGATGPSPSRPAPAPVVRGAYFNPLQHARVTAERIDQGVDYAGTGYLVAIADGVMTDVAEPSHGWPGNYLEYKITHPGELENVHIFYAEGVKPVVHKGELIRGGSRLCDLIPGWHTGIEIGFAAGDGTERTYFGYHDGSYGPYDRENGATRPGIAMSNLIRRLGGPPGRIEGPVVGKFPEYMQSGEPAPGVQSTSTETVGGPGTGGITASGQFSWPGSYLSAFIQLQRGAGQGAHHSHAAWFFARGIQYVTKSPD